MASAPEPTYAIHRERDALILSGDLQLVDAKGIWGELRRATADAASKLVIDLRAVRSADSAVLAMLLEIRRELEARGISTELSHANPRLSEVIALYAASGARPQGANGTAKVGFIENIGNLVDQVIDEIATSLDFIGRLVVTTGVLLRRPRAGNWRGFGTLCEQAGAGAVPIVLLINFLVGFVMAFQSAKQLKLYGANLYVADLVGIALTRELAPLMTAIIVCGRSGAAFAAELGTMKVNEEVDALRALGLPPFGWLVVPRVLALVLVLPQLTLLADFVGITGGLMVASLDLDVPPVGYFNETLIAVAPWDLLSGLIKSVVFAFAIGLIACQQGLATTGGAEGVGKRTTTSVVTTLFVLVALDATFTVLFRMGER
jgi:phospholipid/cholesterol/gamma-HCH transport system permease protein